MCARSDTKLPGGITMNQSVISGKIRSYLHLVGSPQAPKNSEYEVEMSGVREILYTFNASVKGQFIQVVNESKPVFIVISSIFKNQIWKIDFHCREEKKSGKCDFVPILSTDIGAMIVNEIDAHSNGFIEIRRDSESYLAHTKPKNFISESDKRIISFEDLLSFASGTIEWGALKGRSYLLKAKLKKEVSAEEKIISLKSELEEKEKEIKQKQEKLDKLKNTPKKSFLYFLRW